MAGKKGSRSSADFRCGDSFEAQKGRLTSVADVRSRFDPMAEEAKRASVSVRLRSETRSRATTRTAAREPDAGFLAINVTRLRMDVRMDRGILSPCPSLSLSPIPFPQPSIFPTIDRTQWPTPIPMTRRYSTVSRYPLDFVILIQCKGLKGERAFTRTMSHNIPFDNGFVWNALKVRTAFRINIRYEFFRADRSVAPHFSQRPRFPFTVMTRQTGFPPVDSQRASKSCLLPSRSLCPSLFFLEKKKKITERDRGRKREERRKKSAVE